MGTVQVKRVRPSPAGDVGERRSASPVHESERSGPVTDDAAPGDIAPRGVASRGAGTSALRRHRLPVALAIVALCLYLGSIVYIVFIRGSVA